MLGRIDAAKECYQACEATSSSGSEMNLTARASLVFLDLAAKGTLPHRTKLDIGSELDATGAASLIVAGQLLEAVTTTSIQKSK